MGGFFLIAAATCVGTVASIVAVHYLRLALKRWTGKERN